MKRGWRSFLVVHASALALLGAGTAEARDVVVRSFDGTPIVTHFYPAAGLRAGERAPTVLYGSGYVGRGQTAADGLGTLRLGLGELRNDGFNVLTWDPRGFGGSGGTSMFDAPAFEGRDVQALVDFVAGQAESLLDAAGDPRVGMYGSSYAGAIQLITAPIEPRLDALVPDVSWHSLVTTFAKDGAWKAAWLVQLCLGGEAFGLMDGIIDGLTGPTGLQLNSIDARLRTMCLEGAATGRLSAASTQWLASIGPGANVSRIRVPTLLQAGVVDSFIPPTEAIANYELLRGAGVPVKMMWHCAGHDECVTPSGDQAVPRVAALKWLRRWLRRDASVDTGPAFEWIDDTGTWRSAAGYPVAAAGVLNATGSGSVTVLPSVTVTLDTTVVATPPLSVLELRYAPGAADADILGEPALTLTYRGSALPASTFLYAQVFDAAAGRVVANASTPIPVALDGREHTLTRKLEAVAIRGRPSSDLRLRLVPSTSLYGPQRSLGSVTVSSLTSTLPLVDPAPPAAPPLAAPTSKLRIVKVTPGGGARAESVTLRNDGKRAVRLKGYALRDAGRHRMRFRRTSLRSKRNLVVVTGCRKGSKRPVRRGRRYYACRSRQLWDDAGDVVELVSAKGRLLSRRTY